MRKRIHTVILNLLIFVSVSATLSGIRVRQGIIGYILLGSIFGIAMMFVPILLKFFRLPLNFAARLLVGSLVSILVFVSYRYLILGFVDFAPEVIGGSVTSWLSLPRLELDKLGIVIYGAIMSALISVIMVELSKKRYSDS